MPRGRKLVACQVRCQTVISMATSMTDEQWHRVFPVVERKLMLAAAQESLANRRPILVLPVNADSYRAACEKAGRPADGRLRDGE